MSLRLVMPEAHILVVRVKINYDLSIEQMMGKPRHDEEITAEHFPNIRNGKSGTEETNLHLVTFHHPPPAYVPPDFDTYREFIDELGFIPEGFPAVASLAARSHLLARRWIYIVIPLDSGSGWQPAFDPFHRSLYPCLCCNSVRHYQKRFRLYRTNCHGVCAAFAVRPKGTAIA